MKYITQLRLVSVFVAVIVATSAVLSTVNIAYATDIGGFDDYYSGGYGFDDYASGGYEFDDYYSGGYGFDDYYSAGYDDYYNAGYDDYYNTGYDDYYSAGYDDYYNAGYDDYYNAGYDDYNEYFEEETTYYDSGCSCYSYGSSGSQGSVSGKSFMPAYSSSGYSMTKPMSFGSPSYPSYPSYPSQPAKPVAGGSTSNITNTTVTNTNIDNSINDSFNNYNSGNTTIAYVAPATPQYPIVYTAPAPYCQIYQAQASGSGVTAAYLSWNSSNATSAYLTNVGSVSLNGSQTVWPTTPTTYVLTVYGQNGGSAQCQVFVNANAPYVSLTQIPYTGFDFGTFGNAIYWTILASLAVAASYLAIYFKGGMLAFAGSIVSTRKYAPVIATMAPILVQKEIEAAKVQPIVHPVIAAIRKTGTTALTTDSMAIVASKDGSMPKIVISRD